MKICSGPNYSFLYDVLIKWEIILHYSIVQISLQFPCQDFVNL